jgi:ATP-dependent Clp protease ATP-binding subunit ClpX
MLMRRPRNAYCSFCRKSYQDVGPLVEGPDQVYVCGDCIELCQAILKEEKRRRGNRPPAAEALRGMLEPLPFVSQNAREALILIGTHYADPSQGPVLLLGPANSSRLFLAKALARALGVPFAFADVSTTVRSGIETPASLAGRIVQQIDFDLAPTGVVYVSGADERVTQEAVLQLCNGTMTVPGGQSLKFDASHSLLILGGEFAGLDAAATRTAGDPKWLVTGDALVSFGMVPALAHRLRAIVRVDPLDEETLGRIVAQVDVDRLPKPGG